MSLEPVVHTFIRKPQIIEMRGSDFVFKSPFILANTNKKLVITKSAAASYKGLSSTAAQEDVSAKNVVRDAFHGQIEKGADGEVDLVAEFQKHPDALWIRVKAIEAEIPNDNGDCFSREEIKKAYKSFEGCPVFTNHENTKVENAKGKVVKAEWDEKEGSVYCTMFVDKKANAALCRAIEEGYVTDVSMGTQVEYSTCSECKNKAYTAEDYCTCVKTRKGRKSGGKMVYENNYGLKFIEISVVTDGACKDCTIREVIDPEELMAKVSNVIGSFKKTAAFTKDSGQAEIQKLNQAMDLLEDVSRSMLDQRQYIDLEFLSKVTDVLADLQHVNDELVDQGYGSIGQQQAQPTIPPPSSGVGILDGGSATPSPSSTETEGIGKVTSPATANSKWNVITARIKELQKDLKKISEDRTVSRGGVTAVDIKANSRETIMKLAKIWDNPSVKKYVTEVSDGGEFKIAIAGDEVIGLRNGKKISSLKKANLDSDVLAFYEKDPVGCAKELLEELKASFASGRIRTAEVDEKKQHESTFEKQLDEQKPELHARENDERDETMEGQLSKKRESYDQHARQNSTKESTTEKQLGEGEKGYDYHKRQGTINSAEQTMELQLRDKGIHGNDNPADRESSVGVSDQREQPIGGQLDDWRKTDKGYSPTDYTTEKQLAQDSANWGRRIASKDDAKLALAAGTKALVQTALATGATPEELLLIVADFTSSTKNTVAAISAVDSLAAGKETRQALYKRSKFHGASKTASTSAVADFLLGSLADNSLSGEIGLKVLAGIATRKNAVAEIGEAIVAGQADDQPVELELASSDYLREVLAGDEKSDEDLVIVNLKSAQVNEDPKNVDKFAAAAFALATKSASKNGYAISQNIQVANKNGIIEVTMKGVRTEVPVVASSEEVKKDSTIAARKEARRKLLAQMGGATPDGGMGMGGGAPPGGGGGTTMPTPPPADPAAGGTPPTSSLGEPGAGGDEGDEEPSGEALPPGSICPVCGSDKVDMRGGELDCKDCGAHGHIEVDIKMDNWGGTIEDTTPKKDGEESGEEEGGIGDMGGGAGMEMPPMGLAASFKITPEMVRKAGNKPIGSYCPHCASSNVRLASKNGCVKANCNHCGDHYRVDMFVSDKNEMWARMAWKDKKFSKFAAAKRQKLVSVASANKAKAKALNIALAEAGLTMKFVKASANGKIKIVGGLIEKGLLKVADFGGTTPPNPNENGSIAGVPPVPQKAPVAQPGTPNVAQPPVAQPGISNVAPKGKVNMAPHVVDPKVLQQKMMTATPEQHAAIQKILSGGL